MISKTSFACAIALLSVLTCSDHVFAQRGGRGAGGGRDAGNPAAENGEQGMAGRGGQRSGAGGQAGNAASGATSKLFAAIDANQDGVITREEMKEAMQAFAKLDEDKDGKLTAQEAAGQSGGGRGAAMRGQGNGVQRGGNGQAPDGAARRGGGRGDAEGRGGAAGRAGGPGRGADSNGPSGKGNPLKDN